MIAWFARNDVAANLLLAVIIVSGMYCLLNETRVEVFPRTELDIIEVSVPWRGATPEDIELGVAIRIEEAVQALEGVEKITSRSAEGVTTATIEVAAGYDAREILADVKNRVDAINAFPVDIEKPVIRLAQFNRSVISVVVSGALSEREIRFHAENTRDELLRLPDITQAALEAVRKYEINVEVSQDRLRDYRLSLAEIAAAIRASSLDLSAGNVRAKGGDVLIRSKGQAYRRDEFENIVVKVNPDGGIVRLGAVASVRDAFEEASLKTSFNGDYAALIQIDRVGDQSALRIASQVKDYIAARQDSLPAGLSLTYWDDSSSYLRARLSTLGRNAWQGGLLVMLLLSLFLRPAVSLWVFVGIPVSFLGSFVLMSMLDVSINMLSAFGFILVLGIVVDDAIVTGESIYARKRAGGDGLQAAVEGTRQVTVPVTFGMLTTVAAFMPMLFLGGQIGNYLFAIPAVVVCCLAISWMESKLVLPSHLKRIRVQAAGDGADDDSKNNGGLSAMQRRFADGFEDLIRRRYKPLLELAIANRYTMLAGFCGVFVLVTAIVMSGWMRFTFLPRIESDTATATLTMPVGTPFEVTERHTRRIAAAAEGLRRDYIDSAEGFLNGAEGSLDSAEGSFDGAEGSIDSADGDGGRSVVRNILSTTGSARRVGAADHRGQVIIETIPSDQRESDIRMSALVNDWRRRIGVIPGAESLTFRAEIARTGDPVAARFNGRSLEQLAEISERVKAQLRTYPTVFDIADSLSGGKEELRIELTRQGHVLGLTRSDIVGQVSQAFRGFEAQRVQRGRDDIRVLVRLPAKERGSVATLDEYLIATADGRRVPLSHVATLTPGKGPATITRIDRYRVVTVTADVDKEKTNMTVLQADLKQFIDGLLSEYPGVAYQLEGEAEEQRKAFADMRGGLVLLLFVIYTLLALPLKSYTQPLIVMSVIPFGMIGAIFGHWIMGYGLSFMSLMGLMALLGVVVNDSLVLMDYINQRLRRGADLMDAVMSAGQARFRPVILTSLTTFIGLIPLTLEKSVQAQFLIPMALSLGFGVLFATMITLLMVPCNVLIRDDMHRGLSRLAAMWRDFRWSGRQAG